MAIVEEVSKKLGPFELVDFKFVDIIGKWQHFTIPQAEFTDNILIEGIGFDGSSIKGFQSIDKSDMLLMPDMNGAFIDPFSHPRTVSIICTIAHPVTLQPYDKDPRTIAIKAEAYLKKNRPGYSLVLGS